MSMHRAQKDGAALRKLLPRGVVALIFVAVLASGAMILLGSSSSAATPGRLHRGKGYAVSGGDFVGYYVTARGAKVYCLSPRKALPAGIDLHRGAGFRGMRPVVARELSFALASWGDARTAYAAAAESQLVNSIVGNRADVARRARQLPHSIASLVARRLATTRRSYGRYTVAVRTPQALLPGRSGTGIVLVTSATGHRLPGTSVLLSSSGNATVPRTVTTDRRGIGRFRYRVTDVGEVHIRARAVGLAPTALRLNRPRPWEQRMVSWAPLTSARAATSFRRSPSGFSHSYDCTSACDGTPRTTLRTCAPASGTASRIVFRIAGRHRAVIFPAAGERACKSLVVTTSDGDHVSAAWQFRTPHGWSRTVAAAGSFVVDCPAVPAVTVTMNYDCSTASVSIALARDTADGGAVPLINPTRHRMVLVIGGATQQRVYADPGESATFTAAASCRSPRTYTMQAGVQRSSGRYNYGAIASITTPSAPSAAVIR
jgi:hypothetical protein